MLILSQNCSRIVDGIISVTYSRIFSNIYGSSAASGVSATSDATGGGGSVALQREHAHLANSSSKNVVAVDASAYLAGPK